MERARRGAAVAVPAAPPANLTIPEQQEAIERQRRLQTRDAIIRSWNKPLSHATFRKDYGLVQQRDIAAHINCLKSAEKRSIDEHGAAPFRLDDQSLSLLRAANEAARYEEDKSKLWRADEARVALARTIMATSDRRHWTDAVASSISGVAIKTLEGWRTALRQKLGTKNLLTVEVGVLVKGIEALNIHHMGRPPIFTDEEATVIVGVANADAQAGSGHNRRQLGTLARTIAKESAEDLPPSHERDRLSKAKCGRTWMTRAIARAAAVPGGELQSSAKHTHSSTATEPVYTPTPHAQALD